VEFIGFVALALVVVAVMAVTVLFVYGEHRRLQAIRMECLRRGWRYQTEDSALVDRWTAGPFGTGTGRRARNVVTGERDDQRFVAFEYSYKRSSGVGEQRRTTTYTFSVCALALPVPLPMLQVEPEGWLSRVADAVGIGDQIDVESAAFNRAFAVRAQDRKFAYDVLHPRHLEALLAAKRIGWWIEGTDILSSAQCPLDLDEVLGVLDHLGGVVSQIPDFVWRDRGYDPDDASGRPRSAT
jgi:hypothetical protein